MGNRRRVWSSFGGTWHRVRVRYPTFWPRYGRGIPTLLMRAGVALAAGGALVRWWRPAMTVLADVSPVARTVGSIGVVVGVLSLGYGLYVVVRVVIDAAAPATLTGQVLWV